MLRTPISRLAGVISAPAFAALALALTSCASHDSGTVPSVGPMQPNTHVAASARSGAAATRIFAGEALGGVVEYRATDSGNPTPVARIGAGGFFRGLTPLGGKLYALNVNNDKRADAILWVYPSTTDASPPPINTDTCAGHLSGGVDVDAAGFAYTTNHFPMYDANGKFIGFRGDILIFPANTNGCVPSKNQTIVSTALSEPTGIRIGSNGDVYVVDATNNSIVVFPPHLPGGVPKRIITGTNTLLNGPRAVALDAAQNVYVANSTTQGDSSVTVYAANSSANAAPLRTIKGPNTGLFSVQGIAVDGAGLIYVSSYNNIGVFATNASGNVPPLRAITPAQTPYFLSIAVQ